MNKDWSSTISQKRENFTQKGLTGVCYQLGLEKDKDLDIHFPLEEITSDYLNASSSIRDARSRIVTLKFKLSSLKLDYKAQDKFLRLIGKDRYSPDTDTVTITSDRCPYR